jgi:hypothetical protein
MIARGVAAIKAARLLAAPELLFNALRIATGLSWADGKLFVCGWRRRAR